MRYQRPAALSLVLLALVVTACSSATTPQLPPDAQALDVRPFPETVAQYLYSGVLARERLVIRDAETWRQFWDELTSSQVPRPEVPEVDFESEMVIVAAMGTRATGGYSIHVDDVYESDGPVYAVVREVSPGAYCIVTQAVTAPATAVRVPRRDAPVEFIEESVRTDCT